MSLKHILLVLTKEPVSGYELNQVVAETISHFWSADQAQLYRTLKQLEESGLLTKREKAPDRGPPKKSYCRTEEGGRELVRWLRSGPQMSASRNAYVAQLVFLHEACDLSVTIEFLQRLRSEFAGNLERFSAVEAAEPKVALSRRASADFHGALGLRLATDVSQARLDWCDWAIGVTRRRAKFESDRD